MPYANYCKHTEKTYKDGIWHCTACGEWGLDSQCPDCGTVRTFVKPRYPSGGGYWECPVCDEHLVSPEQAQRIITDWKGNRLKGGKDGA